jgi:deoxycytidine triphosphate deaminase
MAICSTTFFTIIRILEDGKKEFAPRRPADRTLDGHNRWVVNPHSSYDLVTRHSVEIPEGMVGWCHIRSTLSRNGVILSGGLYDAGYDGVIGFTIHNLTNNVLHLDPGVRVAQFIMGTAETAHLYDGHYNQNGGHSK